MLSPQPTSARLTCLTKYIAEALNTLSDSLDVRLETNFPDIRSKCLIHSGHGICGIVPREDDMVRMYIQLAWARALFNLSIFFCCALGGEPLQVSAIQMLQVICTLADY